MYLGIDLGTSSAKLLLINEEQQIIGSSSQAIPVARPQPGWSEQDPQDWIRAIEDCLDTLAREHGAALSSVKGIGLSGHMHGATVLDAGDEILRPCILWNDTRSHAEAAELDADPIFRKLSGNIVFPGFTAPKLLWMKNNEPDLFAKVAKVLLPKDYVRFWLTGEHVSEMSDSAGTSWLDVGARDWSSDLLAASHMSVDQMPRLVEGSEASGTLRTELANRWNMKTDAVVAGGAGDNAAAAIGMGTVKDGAAFVSLGTSGVLFAANDGYKPNPESAVHAFCHAVPNTWHQMGVILSATDSMNWLSRLTGQDVAKLDASLGSNLKAPSGVTFLPYLGGERTPHNDAAVRGQFFGLDHESDASTLTQSVMEGVSFAMRDSLAALQEAGTELSRVVAVGGGAKSDYWLSVMATVLNIPVDIVADGDFGASFGAARLGLLAAEGANPADTCTPPEVARTVEPHRDLTDAFAQAYEKYRALYQATKNLN